VLSLTASEYLTENELAAAALADGGTVVNAQTQQRFTWPAEPVVARAFLDQLLRGDLISATRADDLGRALDAAEAALETGNGGAEAGAGLSGLAALFVEEGEGRDGVTASRYAELAATLNGIAGRFE